MSTPELPSGTPVQVLSYEDILDTTLDVIEGRRYNTLLATFNTDYDLPLTQSSSSLPDPNNAGLIKLVMSATRPDPTGELVIWLDTSSGELRLSGTCTHAQSAINSIGSASGVIIENAANTSTLPDMTVEIDIVGHAKLPDVLIPNGGSTYDRTPLVRLTADTPLEAGDQVQVSRNGAVVGIASVQPDGSYHYQETAPLAAGTYSYRGDVLTGSNAGPISVPYTITVKVPNPSYIPFVSISNPSPEVLSRGAAGFASYELVYEPKIQAAVPELVDTDTIIFTGRRI